MFPAVSLVGGGVVVGGNGSKVGFDLQISRLLGACPAQREPKKDLFDKIEAGHMFK